MDLSSSSSSSESVSDTWTCRIKHTRVYLFPQRACALPESSALELAHQDPRSPPGCFLPVDPVAISIAFYQQPIFSGHVLIFSAVCVGLPSGSCDLHRCRCEFRPAGGNVRPRNAEQRGAGRDVLARLPPGGPGSESGAHVGHSGTLSSEGS